MSNGGRIDDKRAGKTAGVSGATGAEAGDRVGPQAKPYVPDGKATVHSPPDEAKAIKQQLVDLMNAGLFMKADVHATRSLHRLVDAYQSLTRPPPFLTARFKKIRETMSRYPLELHTPPPEVEQLMVKVRGFKESGAPDAAKDLLHRSILEILNTQGVVIGKLAHQADQGGLTALRDARVAEMFQAFDDVIELDPAKPYCKADYNVAAKVARYLPTNDFAARKAILNLERGIGNSAYFGVKGEYFLYNAASGDADFANFREGGKASTATKQLLVEVLERARRNLTAQA